ncbi:hypothetical protein DDZ14_14040 [Maritimibacter sp. 55A14]|uniref:TIGR02186 family protein n=1 Tax=Maritimibacter sp. 55A14 TaxID=2174844 RepID=UPI000D607943|nr:TIGR02186 family protein [Maritimibacter sp. 55A14]PWE31142.1 hypothetical protein DDZ14_14040 [Maritimibacter sp. 55A14]
MERILAFTLLLLLPIGASAEEEVVAGLSQNRVSITANFDGSEIVVYGAVKRMAPPPEAGPLQVIVTITGPSRPVVVRRKERVWSIWVNTDSVEVDAAPSFYAVASTGPLNEVLSEVEDLRHRISINRMIRSVGAPMTITDAQTFSSAVVRLREKNDLYQTAEGGVRLDQETLFRANVALPANLVEGHYTARIFLTRDRQVVSSHETVIEVSKVGLERWIFDLAHEKPLLYGLLSIFIAILAGWGASAVFQRIRL